MEDTDEIKVIKAPKLDPIEKLYVRAYLSKLSHSYAHSVVSPGIKHPKEDNPYSRRENVQFHISQALHEKLEAFELSPEVIIEKLYKEATREDRSASHNARIQALTILGKHLGLFTEKKEKETFTFNIVNYSSSPTETTVSLETSDSTENLLDSTEDSDYSEDLEFTDYNDSH